MRETPSYWREAARHPSHVAILAAGGVAAVVALLRGLAWPLLALAILEAAYLLLVPRSPAFRRAVDRQRAEEQRRQHALELERIAARLSPNARSRYDGVTRMHQKILDAMRSLGPSAPLLELWGPRLEATVHSALRLLVAVDSTRADDRDQRFLASEVRRLEAEVAGLQPGAARDAKAQQLDLARKRVSGFAGLKDQREAAVAQFETLEALLQDLLVRGLAGRDAGQFGRQLEELSARIDAAGESIRAIDAHAGLQGELAALPRH